MERENRTIVETARSVIYGGEKPAERVMRFMIFFQLNRI